MECFTTTVASFFSQTTTVLTGLPYALPEDNEGNKILRKFGYRVLLVKNDYLNFMTVIS